jgi:hypothetical protein
VDRREEIWAADIGAGAVEQILDLIIRPPLPAELRGITPEDFEYELSRILTMIGARSPTTLLARIGPLLSQTIARGTIIEVIGSLGIEEGLGWLKPLIDDCSLTEDDAIRLACALGEIGGSAASALLNRFEAATGQERTRVLDEIGIAREAAARRRLQVRSSGTERNNRSETEATAHGTARHESDVDPTKDRNL